jgi:hypothetical protein
MSAKQETAAPMRGKRRGDAVLDHEAQQMPRRETVKETVDVVLPELPKGWSYASVSQVGATDEQAVLTGPFGTNLGRGDFIEDGIPLLTISCLTDRGIRLDKALFVSQSKAKELQRYRLKSGDLLFSRMASVGRAGIVGPDLEGALFNYHIMRLRLNDAKVLPKFFTGYVRGAKQVRDYLLAVNHGATRDGINTIASPRRKSPGRRSSGSTILRTNLHFTLKENTLKRSDLDDFVACYNRKNRNDRKESERFKSFSYEELSKRDKLNLDIFWLKDDALEESANLPAPEIIAADITADLEAALEQFATIAEDLKGAGP